MIVHGRVPRVRRAGPAMAWAGLFALCLSCGGPSLPTDQDPLARASSISTVPPNVGPANCEPPSSPSQIRGGAEIRAWTEGGDDVWALIVGAPDPIRSGQALEVWWRIGGRGELKLVLIGPKAREENVEGAVPDPTLGWSRPGDEWRSTIQFPQPGCWRISATRGSTHGDIWLRVS
jgi:hypothetical protein